MQVRQHYRRDILQEGLGLRVSQVEGEVAVEVDPVGGGLEVVAGGHDEQLQLIVGGRHEVRWSIELFAAQPSDLLMLVVMQYI